MSALSWLKFGHSRHGHAARMHVGVFFRLSVREIRIAPFCLRSGYNFTSDFLTRTTETQFQDWDTTQAMARIRLGRKWRNFAETTISMQQYREMDVSPTVYYDALKNLSEVFADLDPRSFSM